MFISWKTVRNCIFMIGIGIITGIGLHFYSASHVSPTFSDNEKFTVVCDAGHGEPDGGAVGANGTLEKDINLAITLKLQEVLENSGIKVILTRTGDSGLHGGVGSIRAMKLTDMHKRLEIINNSNADLFLSVHMNSFTDKSVSGIHVFYGEKYEFIKPLAEEIMNNTSSAAGAQAHDVKTAEKSLYLMKNSNIPSILVECGFLSNPDEEKKLNDDSYQSKLAWAIGKSIVQYRENIE